MFTKRNIAISLTFSLCLSTALQPLWAVGGDKDEAIDPAIPRGKRNAPVDAIFVEDNFEGLLPTPVVDETPTQPRKKYAPRKDYASMVQNPANKSLFLKYKSKEITRAEFKNELSKINGEFTEASTQKFNSLMLERYGDEIFNIKAHQASSQKKRERSEEVSEKESEDKIVTEILKGAEPSADREAAIRRDLEIIRGQMQEGEATLSFSDVARRHKVTYEIVQFRWIRYGFDEHYDRLAHKEGIQSLYRQLKAKKINLQEYKKQIIAIEPNLTQNRNIILLNSRLKELFPQQKNITHDDNTLLQDLEIRHQKILRNETALSLRDLARKHKVSEKKVGWQWARYGFNKAVEDSAAKENIKNLYLQYKRHQITREQYEQELRANIGKIPFLTMNMRLRDLYWKEIKVSKKKNGAVSNVTPALSLQSKKETAVDLSLLSNFADQEGSKEKEIHVDNELPENESQLNAGEPVRKKQNARPVAQPLYNEKALRQDLEIRNQKILSGEAAPSLKDLAIKHKVSTTCVHTQCARYGFNKAIEEFAAQENIKNLYLQYKRNEITSEEYEQELMANIGKIPIKTLNIRLRELYWKKSKVSKNRNGAVSNVTQPLSLSGEKGPALDFDWVTDFAVGEEDLEELGFNLEFPEKESQSNPIETVHEDINPLDPMLGFTFWEEDVDGDDFNYDDPLPQPSGRDNGKRAGERADEATIVTYLKQRKEDEKKKIRVASLRATAKEFGMKEFDLLQLKYKYGLDDKIERLAQKKENQTLYLLCKNTGMKKKEFVNLFIGSNVDEGRAMHGATVNNVLLRLDYLYESGALRNDTTNPTGTEVNDTIVADAAAQNVDIEPTQEQALAIAPIEEPPLLSTIEIESAGNMEGLLNFLAPDSDFEESDFGKFSIDGMDFEVVEPVPHQTTEHGKRAREEEEKTDNPVETKKPATEDVRVEEKVGDEENSDNAMVPEPSQTKDSDVDSQAQLVIDENTSLKLQKVKLLQLAKERMRRLRPEPVIDNKKVANDLKTEKARLLEKARERMRHLKSNG